MNKKITYKSSGVDIQKANRFVSGIAAMAASTMNSAVLNRPGSFGALFSLNQEDYREPVLVSSTDGVGTKLLIANALNKHDTVGIDLVAMNVNDILCVGAKPLFFLDYIACGKLNPSVLNTVLRGIAKGCALAGCSLIGGETAEMPGMYKPKDYDLAGFAVGVVEKSKIIDGSTIQKGDCVIGLASSGLHSNGFSLVRRVLSQSEQKKFSKEILAPTRIYVKPVLDLIRNFKIKGIAHITGGAYYEKLTKIVPADKCFKINKKSWPVPEIFKRIQSKGKITDREMYTTFNMGIGLALVVGQEMADAVRQSLSRQDIKNFMIGEVVVHQKQRILL